MRGKSNKIALGSLNINSLPNKIDGLRTSITNNLDVSSVVQETKIDTLREEIRGKKISQILRILAKFAEIDSFFDP